MKEALIFFAISAVAFVVVAFFRITLGIPAFSHFTVILWGLFAATMAISGAARRFKESADITPLRLRSMIGPLSHPHLLSSFSLDSESNITHS